MKTALEILIEARAKITKRKNWNKYDWASRGGIFSRDLGIQHCGHPEARAWCAVGALYAVSNPINYKESYKARQALNKSALTLFEKEPISVNFCTFFAHRKVLQMYDHAIKSLQVKS